MRLQRSRPRQREGLQHRGWQMVMTRKQGQWQGRHGGESSGAMLPRQKASSSTLVSGTTSASKSSVTS